MTYRKFIVAFLVRTRIQGRFIGALMAKEERFIGAHPRSTGR